MYPVTLQSAAPWVSIIGGSALTVISAKNLIKTISDHPQNVVQVADLQQKRRMAALFSLALGVAAVAGGVLLLQSQWQNGSNQEEELANLLIGSRSAPEQAVESLFQGVWQGIQEKGLANLDSPGLKDTIWERVSPPLIAESRKHMIQNVVSKILSNFSSLDIQKMLLEKKLLGKVFYRSEDLLAIYATYRSAIINSVVSEVDSMKYLLGDKIIAVLRELGTTTI